MVDTHLDCGRMASAPTLNGVQYDADYFLRGVEKGVSLYENYRWLPDLTIPMVKAIVGHLGIKPGDRVLDFGCARGYVVRAFRELGYAAHGYDTSKWAVENCDPQVASYVTNDMRDVFEYDWVIAKDVFEHIPHADLPNVITTLANIANRGMFAVVPVSDVDHGPYIVPQYERDVTHHIRVTLETWKTLIQCCVGHHWDVRATHRVPGVKDNYYEEFPRGNGFITALR